MDMNFGMRAENRQLLERVATMVRDEIMPLEAEYQAEIGKQDRYNEVYEKHHLGQYSEQGRWRQAGAPTPASPPNY